LIEATVAGESLELHAERAIYWRRRQTLIVADPHFGKAAAFRAAGVFVPEATTMGALDRISKLLDTTGATRIVFLGDFLHAKEGRHPDTFEALRRWRAARQELSCVLVRGNHDRRAGDPPAEVGLDCMNAPVQDAPFAFAHHPTHTEGAYTLAGHVHPGVLLAGAGRQYVRLPCFWFRASVGVLPAFGDFTGLADVSPAPDDRVYVIAGERVLAK